MPGTHSGLSLASSESSAAIATYTDAVRTRARHHRPKFNVTAAAAPPLLLPSPARPCVVDAPDRFAGRSHFLATALATLRVGPVFKAALAAHPSSPLLVSTCNLVPARLELSAAFGRACQGSFSPRVRSIWDSPRRNNACWPSVSSCRWSMSKRSACLPNARSGHRASSSV
jgi:hypothetical protein